MAIFRVPRITTALRNALLLQEAEIVFDTDLKKFFGGDGVTVGGVELSYSYQLTTESSEPMITEIEDLIKV